MSGQQPARRPSPQRARPVAAPTPLPEAARALKLYAGTAAEPAEYQPHRTAFLERIHNLSARTVHDAALPPSNRTLAEVRGYREEDLMIVAEIAYQYLFNGGARLALVLYEGLAAVSPKNAYFALALGLTHDHLGAPEKAHHWYQTAAELDPLDGRADINRAELYIQARELGQARKYLSRGAAKALRKKDSALETKAAAMSAALDRLEQRKKK